MPEKISIPLMANNIAEEDFQSLIEFLKTKPIVTQSNKVREFEEAWSKWLGKKHSVFVNSGSSANLITLAALKHLHGLGEVIVPPLTWVSDIAGLLHLGFTPVFCDIDPYHLGLDEKEVLKKITPHTKAVFLTHILGFNGLSQNLLNELAKKKIPLIEDVCESYGATFQNKKLGSFGLASNFSFYYAHHLSTIEGGMVSTDDEHFYQALRMLRSHGMVREASNQQLKDEYQKKFPDLNPDFIFAYPAWNVRSTELNAVIGLKQLQRLDEQNDKRRFNCELFYKNIDPQFYRTDFRLEGSCNYAFVLVIKNHQQALLEKVKIALKEAEIEFRQGTSGGGNQLRQPYLRNYYGDKYKEFPQTDYIHFFGFYIGNYPNLETEKILKLCQLLNSLGNKYENSYHWWRRLYWLGPYSSSSKRRT